MVFIRLCLVGLMLFPVSILADEEKLIIVPAEDNEIPTAVKNSVEAIGELDSGVGFFINQNTFITSIGETTLPSASYKIVQFREVTVKETEAANLFQEGEIVSISSGTAQIVQGRYGWGVFKVSMEEKEQLFTNKPTSFLTFSEFHPGDTVFILTNYHYDHEDASGEISYKKRLIMKISNSDAQNIEANIDFNRSVLLGALRGALNRSIVVNQKGEVIGLIDLEWGVERMVTLDSDVVAFFFEMAKDISNADKESNKLSPELELIRALRAEEAKKKPKEPKTFLQRCVSFFTRKN